MTHGEIAPHRACLAVVVRRKAVLVAYSKERALISPVPPGDGDLPSLSPLGQKVSEPGFSGPGSQRI